MVTLPWEWIPCAILPLYRHEQFTTFQSEGWKWAWCVSANLWTQGSTHQYCSAFLEKTKQKKWGQRKRGHSKQCEIGSGKILICVVASWTKPFPTLHPARTSEWTWHSKWHGWLLANHFNGVQTKISSLIVIMPLNVNYGRAHPQLPWCLTINGLSSKWRVFQTFPANWNVWSVQSWCHRIIWNLSA